MAKKHKPARSLWFYVAIGLAIILVAGLLYIPVPVQKPHPEDLSPYIYLVAIAAGLFAFFKFRSPHKYLLIPAFALLGFLEEISWGAEWGLFKPFYWNGFKIYDIHNVLPSVFRSVRHALGLRFWNAAMLDQFLLVDLLLLLAFFVLFLLVQRTKAGKDFQASVLKLVLAFFMLFSAAALARLLILPSASGLSLTRLAMDGMLVVVLALAGWTLFKIRDNKFSASALRKINAWFKPLTHRAASWFLAIALLLSLVYQVFASTRSLLPEQAVLFDRLNPLALWVSASLLLIAVFVYMLQTRFPHPNAAVPRPSLQFFRNNPTFIFVIFAGLWLFIAQMIDRGVILIRPNLPHFWIKDWGLWIEELLEMTSAVELVTASFFFSNKKTPH